MSPIQARMKDIRSLSSHLPVQGNQIYFCGRDPEPPDPLAIDAVMPQVANVVANSSRRPCKNLKKEIFRPPASEAGDQVEHSPALAHQRFVRASQAPIRSA